MVLSWLCLCWCNMVGWWCLELFSSWGYPRCKTTLLTLFLVKVCLVQSCFLFVAPLGVNNSLGKTWLCPELFPIGGSPGCKQLSWPYSGKTWPSPELFPLWGSPWCKQLSWPYSLVKIGCHQSCLLFGVPLGVNNYPESGVTWLCPELFPFCGSPRCKQLGCQSEQEYNSVF